MTQLQITGRKNSLNGLNKDKQLNKKTIFSFYYTSMPIVQNKTIGILAFALLNSLEFVLFSG